MANARLCRWHGLVFFLTIFCSCHSDPETELHIRWSDNKATALVIPEKSLKGVTADSIGEWLKVVVQRDSNTTAILGGYTLQDSIVFEPLVPFSRGLSYDVFYKGKKIGAFQVPGADTRDAPSLMAVYPLQDTLPENLLKFYIRFSQPMNEGEAYKHITLIKGEADTLHNVFLDLEPELWNEERTVITILLDPGRIKRGLQPNERLGSPLKENTMYTLLISGAWKDTQGLSLQKNFTKSFLTAKRDSLGPEPAQWDLHPPRAASRQALTIGYKEPLDYFLLEESLGVSERDGPAVEGIFQIRQETKTVDFIPSRPWTKGDYTLTVQSVLEDLAGNNINRPFDRDLYQNKTPSTEPVRTIHFRVSD